MRRAEDGSGHCADRAGVRNGPKKYQPFRRAERRGGRNYGLRRSVKTPPIRKRFPAAETGRNRNASPPAGRRRTSVIAFRCCEPDKNHPSESMSRSRRTFGRKHEEEEEENATDRIAPEKPPGTTVKFKKRKKRNPRQLQDGEPSRSAPADTETSQPEKRDRTHDARSATPTIPAHAPHGTILHPRRGGMRTKPRSAESDRSRKRRRTIRLRPRHRASRRPPLRHLNSSLPAPQTPRIFSISADGFSTPNTALPATSASAPAS